MIINRGKNIMRCLIGVFIAFAVLLSMHSYAIAAAATDRITLAGAIDIAMQNNLSLKLLDTKIENADLNLKYANKLAVSASGKKWLTEDEHVANLKEEFLVPKRKYSIWKNLLLDKEQEVITLKQKITKNYYQVLLIKKSIAVNENNINRVKKDIKTKSELLKKNIEKQQTIDQLNITLIEAEQRQVEAIRQSDMAKIQLNMVLGLPLESKLVLAPESINDSKYNISDLAETIETYILKDKAYIQAITAQEEAQLEYDIVRKNITKQSTDELEQLSEKLLNCISNISNVSDNIELKLHTDYNDLLNLYDDIKINQYKYNLCIKQLDSYKTRLRIGQISQSEYDNKYGDYESLGLALEQARTDYYLAVESYKAYVE